MNERKLVRLETGLHKSMDIEGMRNGYGKVEGLTRTSRTNLRTEKDLGKANEEQHSVRESSETEWDWGCAIAVEVER